MSDYPTWAEYARFTDETASYPGADLRRCNEVPEYVAHGLVEEHGEIRGVFKRRLRDDDGKWTSARLQQLRGEIGDLLWYCARYVVHTNEVDDYDGGFFTAKSYGDSFGDSGWWYCFGGSVNEEDIDGVLVYLQELATEFGWTLAEIAAENMAKLRDRKARGVIQGKGDKR